MATTARGDDPEPAGGGDVDGAAGGADAGQSRRRARPVRWSWSTPGQSNVRVPMAPEEGVR